MFPKALSILVLASFAIAISSCTPRPDATPTSQDTVKDTPAAGTESQIQSFKINLDEQGRALRGYDPVAYFEVGSPIEGTGEFRFTWKGAEWQFVSAENRSKFEQNPEKYAPANGGYCTFGVVLSKKFDGDPEVWTLFKNRLYVFLNEEVKGKFLQDTAGNMEKIGKNWPKIEAIAPENL